MDTRLIYCNGDSYSDEAYHPSLYNKTYASIVASELNGFALNKAISGSCNRRIIRTTVHDLIHQRELNQDQEIIALIGLSFELRGEYWIEEINNLPDRNAEESNYVTHVFSGKTDWKSLLLINKLDDTRLSGSIDKKYHDFYSQGRAFFYSPYAERNNLLCDLLMLRTLMESLDIKFLVFQSPAAETLDNEYLVDFFKTRLYQDPRFFDLEKFSFVQWCADNKFKTLDCHDRPEIAHYGPDAHEAFARQVLLPKLKETNQL